MAGDTEGNEVVKVMVGRRTVDMVDMKAGSLPAKAAGKPVTFQCGNPFSSIAPVVDVKAMNSLVSAGAFFVAFCALGTTGAATANMTRKPEGVPAINTHLPALPICPFSLTDSPTSSSANIARQTVWGKGIPASTKPLRPMNNLEYGIVVQRKLASCGGNCPNIGIAGQNNIGVHLGRMWHKPSYSAYATYYNMNVNEEQCAKPT